MKRMVSVCGLICTECEAYQATQVMDEIWLDRIAAKWREEYSNPAFTAATVACDGCLTTDGWLCSHCSVCKTRQCGADHGVANCGECPEYETCENIQTFFQYVPSAKVVLDEIHAARR